MELVWLRLGGRDTLGNRTFAGVIVTEFRPATSYSNKLRSSIGGVTEYPGFVSFGALDGFLATTESPFPAGVTGRASDSFPDPITRW